MEVIVDGEKQFLLQSNPASVGDALVEINDLLQSQGRALQTIVVDGRNVPAEEITLAFGRTPVSQVDAIQVTSADVIDLVRESLAEMEGVVSDLAPACQQLARVMATENPEEGFGAFNQLLEIWGAFKERQREVVHSLVLDLSVIELEGKSLAGREAELVEALEKAKGAMERSEFTELADFLAYDLFALAEGEADIVALLQSKLPV